MQQQVYECRMNSVDEPKQRLVNWCQVQSAAQHYWRSHQRIEKATESVHACRILDEHSEHLL